MSVRVADTPHITNTSPLGLNLHYGINIGLTETDIKVAFAITITGWIVTPSLARGCSNFSPIHQVVEPIIHK